MTKLARPIALYMLSASGGLGQIITTIAGTEWLFPSYSLQAVNAPLGAVTSLTKDANGNLYVSDYLNSIVARISPDGILTVVAGNGVYGFSGDGGAATNATLGIPEGITIDPAGNLYIADSANNRVRKVTPDGIISTFAGTGSPDSSGDGGPAIRAGLNNPADLALDAGGNLYIADSGNHRIRKVTPAGLISTFAGKGSAGFSGDGGTATNALLNGPMGLNLDASGTLYIADNFNNRVRKVSPNGTITTVAGNGKADYTGDGGMATNAAIELSAGPFSFPTGLAVDTAGNLYIADLFNNAIRKVTANAIISTVAGSGGYGFSGDGGPATSAHLSSPEGVAVDSSDNLYIADTSNERVRRVGPNGTIATIAGNNTYSFAGDSGPATSAVLNFPTNTAVDASGNLYIADTFNNRIRKVSTTGVMSTVAGNGFIGYSGDGGPATSATLSNPNTVAIDENGNLYILDFDNNRVRKVTPNGSITTVAGNGTCDITFDNGFGGPATNVDICRPFAMTLDSGGNIYIEDGGRILKVNTQGVIDWIAGVSSIPPGFSGDGGPASLAEFNGIFGLAVDATGNIYVADTNNNRIRKITTDGKVNTVAGNGTRGFSGDGGLATAAALYGPNGVAVDSAGNLYIGDTGNNRVRKVTPGGIISTIAGNGSSSFSGDGGPATQAALNWPTGVTLDHAGNVYITDQDNGRIRKLLLTQAVSFNASPAKLTFSGVVGATSPASQSVTLSSLVAGLTFTATASDSWLSAAPSPGSMPATLQVSVNPVSLAAGTYQGTITVSSPNATPGSATIAVTLTVQSATPAQLSVGSQNLSFSALQNGVAQTTSLQISNSGGGTLSFAVAATTTDGGAWLSVAPISGTTTRDNPTSLTVTAAPGALGPGTYHGTLSIVGGGGIASVPVTLSVTAPTAVILLSQTGLDFYAVAEGGAPLPQSFGVLNTGQGSMNWSAVTTTTTGGTRWLQVSPRSGTVAQPYSDVSTVDVAIDPTSLVPGTYSGRIQVSAPAANTPQLFTVTLTVLPAGTSPGPELRPSGLIYTGVTGATPGSQDVLIGNPKAEPDSYLSSVIAKGFTYLPTSGDVPSNQPATLRVFPDFTNLQPGEIDHGTITLQFSDGTSRTISVLIVVAPTSSTGSAFELGLQANGCSTQILQLQWRSPRPNFTAVLGQATTLEAQVVDDCGNQIGPGNLNGASVSATFSNHDSALNLTHIGNGIWTGTWKPVKPASGQVTVQVTAFNAVGTLLQNGGTSLSGTLSASATPVVTAGGVVHAASAVAGVPIAPGSLITIYGSNLADAQGLAFTLPLPQSQNGAQVLLGITPLPILYTSPGQLNVQVPFSTPVNTQYQISVQRDSLVSLPEQLVVAQANPGVFAVNEQGTGQGVIFKHDGVTLAQTGTPATEGETVVIYCTGLGAVTPAVPDGVAPPPLPLSTTVNPVTVTIGDQPATVSFSGLTPGYPGLYQINAVVPNGVSGDAVPVVVTVAGQTSPPVTMSVQ